MYSSLFQLVARAFCIFILITTTFTQTTTEPLILKPLTIHEYDSALQLRDRHAGRFDKLDPQAQGRLNFGATRGSVLLAF